MLSFSLWCGYTWRVPTDLEINGDEEELTVTVTYETQKLYGKVTAQRKITIRKVIQASGARFKWGADGWQPLSEPSE